MLGSMFMYLKVFLVGGLICLIAQILIIRTKLTSARILVLFLMIGAFSESKIAPRCKKKEEGLQSNLPSLKTYCPLGLFASCP